MTEGVLSNSGQETVEQQQEGAREHLRTVTESSHQASPSTIPLPLSSLKF